MTQKAEQIAYGTAAVTSGSGLWVWLSERAEAIGAVGVILGAVLAVLTFFLNWYYKRENLKVNKNRK